MSSDPTTGAFFSALFGFRWSEIPAGLLFDFTGWLVLIGGVIAGLIGYWRAKAKERELKEQEQRDREYGTYHALDDKYFEFSKLCLANPKLDIFDVPDQRPACLTDLEKKQELVAFSLLIQIFERAYLMHRYRPTPTAEGQWSGWASFIDEYCGRANFQEAWRQMGSQWDPDFQTEMAQRLAAAAPRPS